VIGFMIAVGKAVKDAGWEFVFTLDMGFAVWVDVHVPKDRSANGTSASDGRAQYRSRCSRG
jgi:hypothetical protein